MAQDNMPRREPCVQCGAACTHVDWLPKAHCPGCAGILLPSCPGGGMGRGCQPMSQPWLFFRPLWLKAPRGVVAV